MVPFVDLNTCLIVVLLDAVLHLAFVSMRLLLALSLDYKATNPLLLPRVENSEIDVLFYPTE